METVENYIYLLLKEPNHSLSFLTEKVGFHIVKKNRGNGDDYVLIRDRFENYFKVMLSGHEAGDHPLPKTILNTPDCLKCYYDLKLNEVEVHGKPHYTSAGLSFDFTDNCGNQFAYLESRDYPGDL